MPSNVSEWCRDEFGLYGSPVAPGDGYRVEARGDARMVRGGSFRDPAMFARSSIRIPQNTVVKDEYSGVRACRALID